ncbi:MAG: NFACT family protein [Candidatus Obscuribacterales bacterium]|nr:NFACT family protein [Cyanobacteria bacterium SZAS LIN-5]RTL38876.1 MAG: fibronectin/fibrinogen-binding protein [Candidatus Melainabacteria bacterium]
MQPFDALTMRAVLSEAKPLLIGRKVDKVYQNARDEIVFSMRAKAGMTNLLLSAQSAYGRICLVRQAQLNQSDKPKPNHSQSQFLLLLRRHLTSSTLVGIEQPTGERTADLIFSCTDEVGGTSLKILTAEVMGRHSNLIFWDKNTEKILTASHVVTQEMSRQREVAAGLRFVRPPKQDKPNIFTVSKEDFFARADDLIEKVQQDVGAPLIAPTVEQWLITTFTGLGRQLSEELVASTGLKSSIQEAVKDSNFKTILWEKSLALQTTDHFKPAMRLDLSRYTVLSWWAGVEDESVWRPFPSANDMVDEYYKSVENREQFQQLRERLRSELKNEIEKLENRISAASQHVTAAEDLDQLKRSGDLILAHLNEIKPGQETLQCANLYGENGATQTIKLNPNLNGSQNAQFFYRQFAKSRSRLTAASAACAEATKRLETVRGQSEAVERAADSEELRRLKDNLIGRKQSELPKTAPAKPNDKKKSKAKILSLTSSDGWTIYVGRNRHENDQLLSRLAQPNDLWLHVLGQGGAHVLIKVPASKQEPPLNTIKEAAQVAARLSKASTGSKVRVVYTQCKHVKKLGKDKPGLVRYENEKTLEIDTSTPMPKCMKTLFSN